MNLRITLLLGGLLILVGCAEEVPPPSVHDFLADPNALEAAMVRCSANRAETRYESECVNARQAVSIIEAKEERVRRDAFEAESAAKRAALRRTQQAAAEARRRAEEAEQRRREAEYLAQFGELPPREDSEDALEAVEIAPLNEPGAVIPPPPEDQQLVPAEEMPPPAGSNAPGVEQEEPQDLSDIRDELRRRNDESSN